MDVMQERYLELLRCPTCHGELVLRDAREQDGEIWSGTLYCGSCETGYDIKEGIPFLMPEEHAEG
ncbi:MAG: Trm112 family protein [Candidatus Thermoplasmatota archaeon]|nr:Trm112 family protein [Candidatus Thermoplasmatota archaeon]